jgi:hypothetical protein
MRALATLCVLCAIGGGIAALVVNGADAAKRRTGATTATHGLVHRIDHYRRVTWRWQSTIGEPRTKSARSARRSPDPAYQRWVLRLWKHRAARVQHRAARWLVARTNEYRRTVSHWQRVMGKRTTAVRTLSSASAGSLSRRKRTMLAWKKRAARVVREARTPPRLAAWRCIHRYEGSWRDRGAPYYGGLQMDVSFQRHYGGYLLRTKGTADRWTPLEQIWVAERAYRSGRGFYPWPNTARACGLL